MVSVVAYTEEGQGAEVAAIGYEGMTGLEAVLAGDNAANQFVTQLSNGAQRMTIADIRAEFERGGDAETAARIHPQANGPDQPDRTLQPSAHDRKTALKMAADVSRPERFGQTEHYAGVSRDHARHIGTSVSITAHELQKSGFIS